LEPDANLAQEIQGSRLTPDTTTRQPDFVRLPPINRVPFQARGSPGTTAFAVTLPLLDVPEYPYQGGRQTHHHAEEKQRQIGRRERRQSHTWTGRSRQPYGV
jgi:hypothetical protein